MRWQAEKRVRILRYHAPALKELSMPVGLRVVEMTMRLFKRSDEDGKPAFFGKLHDLPHQSHSFQQIFKFLTETTGFFSFC
jgi:hypothetical protein